ncbi:MAG: tycC3 [Gemmatimonadetes bacterium]|nr:tycC3 [Gemmatimonadota bacterium]
MNKQNVEDLYPLSPLQQGMLFHTLLAPQDSAYTEQITYDLAGALRVDELHRAWQGAVDRHPALRTAFFWEKLPKPLQVVHRKVVLPLRRDDLRALAPDARAARVEELREADRARGFDLSRPPLVRLTLLRMEDERWTLVFTFHHMLLDGWSLPILLQEVLFTYETAVAGLRSALTPPRPFRDYIGWLGRQDLAAAEGFWRRALAGFAGPVMPAFAPPERPRAGYHKASLRVDEGLTARLQALARSRKVTLNNVVQAAWALLLSRWSGAADVVFGATASGRPAELPGVEHMVGMFINTLPVRARMEPDTTVDGLLERLGAFTAEARLYEHTPLVDVQGWSEVPRDHPLFHALYVFENVPVQPRTDQQEVHLAEAETLPEELGTLRILDAQSPERTTFPLLLVVAPGAEGVALRLVVDTQRYAPETGERMLRHLAHVLERFAANPAARLDDVDAVPADEARRVDALAAGDPLSDTPELLHATFEAQARRTPHAVAVEHGAERVTYAELDARANRLARHLRSLGVGPERRAGIRLPRTPDLIAAMLAVLKAGGAYVPLDPAYPPERIAFILQDTAAAVLVTDAALAADLLPTDAAVVRVDADAGAIAAHPAEPVTSAATPDGLAYVIYTSGSTGRPKGVMIEHRASAAIVRWVARETAGDGAARVLASTSIAFDVSVAEIFGTLCRGATLVLVENALSLATLPADAAVDAVFMVPTAAAELLRAGGIPHTVHTLNLAGEPLPPALAQGLYATPSVRRVRNLYGPTEDTTYSAWSLVPRGAARVHVGRPVPGTRAHVLDARLRPTAEGVPGELYLAGGGVSRGYLGRPGLTAERYLPDPHGAPGSRMYRVMDRVRWSEGGELEYLERVDHQVKIRGYRVELGEIEAALLEHAGVAECVVTARGEGDAPRELVAYWVPAPGRAPSVGVLRGHLKGRLPAYMVPPYFVSLPELPRTTSGKVDRRALPAPEGARAEAVFVAPRNEKEAALAAVWAQVLGVERVGVHDSFFDLGGHSLKATQVVSRAREAVGADIPIRALFETPTIAELVARYAPAAGSAEPLSADGGAIVPFDGEGGAPLSFAQERLWFLDRMEPGRSTYNIPFALRLRGALDADALERALGEIVRRHHALRTVFREGGGAPVQVVLPAEFRQPVEDVSTLPADEREAEIVRRVHDEAVRPFDLARGPLFRAMLLRTEADDHVLAVSFHHAVSDGWSFGVFFGELAALYEAFRDGRPSPLPELAVQYADFAAWQRTRLSGEALAADVAFWRRALAGAPPLLALPTDRPRPPVQTHSGATLSVAFPKESADRLSAVARAAGASLFQALLAAFGTLMARWAAQDDVVAGTSVAGRSRPETEPLIGFFVNTLPIRADVSGDPTFRELLARVREAALGAYAHQDLPFEKLVEELQPERSLAYGPVFQVMFGLQNAGMGGLGLAGLEAEQIAVGATDSKVDLGFSLAEVEHGIAGSIEYNPDLFDEATVARMARQYGMLLDAFAADPDAPVRRVPLLDPAERATVLHAWNDTGREYPSGIRIHDLFETQAATTPDAPALVFHGATLTYAELDRAANRLAHRLIGLGVGRETRVAVCMERAPEMIVALLAVLKAGGAYVPVDPSYPASRIAYVLDDSAAAVVLTQQRAAATLPSTEAHIVAVDADAEAERIAAESAETPRSAATASNAAYAIYTSGSTGQPKGVVIEHRSTVTLLHWLRETVGDDERRRVLGSTSISFDVSVAEIFGTLCWGGTLVLVENALSLAELGEEAGITLAGMVPSAARELLRMGAIPSTVRSFNLAGEPLPDAVADGLYALGTVDMVRNLYGPTEDTTYSTWSTVGRGERVHIGRPVANTQAYVLDDGLQPVPVGVPGELYLAGEGVSRGYLNRPGMTADRYVPNPFAAAGGARMYRVGDRVRFRADGTLEYLGRVDHQVKIRGFRVETGEVEAALAAHSAVREAAVAARDAGDGDWSLAAYVVPSEGHAFDAAELRAHLRSLLPDHMVPSAFMAMDALPQTASGKVDRRALPAVVRDAFAAEAFVAPRTPTERAVAVLYGELLSARGVGAEADFFALGGHSLLATRLVSRVRAELGVELPVRAVFEAPSVHALAARIDAAAGNADEVDAGMAGAAAGLEQVPLSFAQERLWFLDQMEPGAAAFNLPITLRLRGALDADALRRALGEITRRHAVLRAVFGEAGGRPVQRFSPAGQMPLPREDLSSLDPGAREAEIVRLVRAEAVRPFDLAAGPLFRAALVRVSELDHVLLLNMHHAVSDGWSFGILVGEMTALYEAFAAARPSPLPELPVGYADFAVWQRARLSGDALGAQVEFWRRTLGGAPALLELPTDRPRPPVQTYCGATRGIALPADLSERLAAMARAEGATPFMALMAAFQALMGRYGGQPDVVVGTPVAGRNHAQTEGLIGFFVNTLPIRGDLRGEPSFRQLLRRTREATLDAYAHQDLPFEKLVAELAPERSLSHAPVFQVMLALHNLPGGALRLGGLAIEQVAADEAAAKYDLAFTFEESGGTLHGSAQYNVDLFDGATVDRMARHFALLLDGALANPDRPLSRIPLMDDAERALVLASGRPAEGAVDAGGCVHDLFREQARRAPGAVALSFPGQSVTYAELDAASNRLARRLRAAGVGPEATVAVALERGPEMVVAMLAVLKAGGAYLPLDLAYPRERLAFMLRDSGARLAVTRAAYAAQLPAEGIAIVEPGAAFDPALSAADLPSHAGPDNLAYVTYTSGSTGRPKGVMVAHGGLANLALAQVRAFGIGPQSRVLQFASLSFDAAASEVFTALTAGAALVLAPQEALLPGAPLAATLGTERVTVATLPPSVLAAMPSVSLPYLRTLVSAGEALPADVVQRWRGAASDGASADTNPVGDDNVESGSIDGHGLSVDAPRKTDGGLMVERTSAEQPSVDEDGAALDAAYRAAASTDDWPLIGTERLVPDDDR